MGQSIDAKTFEQSVAELANNTLKTKVPALMDYALAFQLVDQDEDGTRAIGIFGFKVGKSLIYVPVFFRSGEIDGTEMAYVVDEDRFVPLTEDWVNQLIRRKTFTIGEEASKDRKQQGITGPDLRRLRIPPTEAKIGTDLGLEFGPTWSRFYVKMFDSAVNFDKMASELPSLPDFLARHDLVIPFVRDMQNQPKLAEAVAKYYGPQDFLDAMDRMGDVLAKTADAKKKPAAMDPVVYKRDVQILDGDDALKNPVDAEALSTEEKKKLMTGNVVIKDNRYEVSKKKVYDFETTKTVQNPTEGGCYDLITEDGDVKRCFILMPRNIGSGVTLNLRLVLTSDGKYLMAPKTTLWTAGQPLEPKECREELESFGDLLKGQDTWDKNSAEGYIIVSGDGAYAFGPFTVDKVTEMSNGDTSLYVQQRVPHFASTTDHVGNGLRDRKGLPFDGDLYTDDGVINLTPSGDPNAKPWNHYQSQWDSVRRVIITNRPLRNSVVQNGIAMVPRDAGFRVVKLTERLTGTSAPGSSIDMHLKINKFAEVLAIHTDDVGFQVDFRGKMHFAGTPKQAAEILCYGVGIGGDETTEIIKLAAEHPKRIQKFWVDRPEYRAEKIAAAQWDDPNFQAHFEPLFDVPVQRGGLSTRNLVPEHASFDPGASQQYRHFKDENNYQSMYGKDIQTLNSATNAGQKDVFDASAIASLANVNDVSEEIENYLPELMRALDKLGRTLFLFYWHGDDIAERYGKTEAKNLEDSIRNVFESLGDTVLELKKSSPNTDDLFGSGIIGGGGGSNNSN
jgi:hypothetical protein